MEEDAFNLLFDLMNADDDIDAGPLFVNLAHRWKGYNMNQDHARFYRDRFQVRERKGKPPKPVTAVFPPSK